MFINKDSIKINGISFGKYLTEVEFQYNKLWSNDSGRNLAGVQSGTLVGIFPKFVLNFRRLTKAELNIVAPILDSARQQFTYYDPTKNQTKTITTYTGDWSVKNKNIMSNEGFNCSFIAVRKRG